jgi:transposase
MSALTCGLDVHKNWSDVTLRNSADGEVVAGRRRLPNDEVGAFLSGYQVERIAMEASTSIIPIYRELKRNGYDVLVSHPKKTRLIAESRIKTDRIDSEALSELARLNALPLSYVPDEKIAELREMVRRRAFLVRTDPNSRQRFELASSTTVSEHRKSMDSSQRRGWHGLRLSRSMRFRATFL